MAAGELSPPEVSVPWPSALASFAREAAPTTYSGSEVSLSGSLADSTEISLGNDLVDFSILGPITLVMKNIPARSTWPDVVDAIDMSGFRGRFEFFYLPTKADGNRCKGYAFVAFGDRAVARAFLFAMDGARWRAMSDKRVSIEVSSHHKSLSMMVQSSRNIHESRFGPVVVPFHAHAAERCRPMVLHGSMGVLSF